MIDASTFAGHHNAFWSDQAPTSEHYVRRINLEYTERWCVPLEKPEGTFRAAFIAELAFSIFSTRVKGVSDSDIEQHALADAKKHLRPLVEQSEALDDPISESEREQAAKLEKNMSSFFSHRKREIVVRPVFAGCGYLDSSEGDVICGSSIFEIKAVDRPFRGVDIKQLLTYCALNYISGQYYLDRIGIFNPRRGVYFESYVDDVCREVSGQPSRDLFDAIINAVSSGDLSR